jgi:hypothetical protein
MGAHDVVRPMSRTRRSRSGTAYRAATACLSRSSVRVWPSESNSSHVFTTLAGGRGCSGVGTPAPPPPASAASEAEEEGGVAAAEEKSTPADSGTRRSSAAFAAAAAALGGTAAPAATALSDRRSRSPAERGRRGSSDAPLPPLLPDAVLSAWWPCAPPLADEEAPSALRRRAARASANAAASPSSALGTSASSAVTIICVARTEGAHGEPRACQRWWCHCAARSSSAARALTCSRLITMVRSRDSSAVEKLRATAGEGV